jgi:integrase
MKREKTKHKGIYKVGETYYVTYYAGSKKYEKSVGPNLSVALKEKMDRETKVRRGNHEILERQEKTTLNQLMDLYKSEGDGKDYILQFEKVFRDHFGNRRIWTINRSDLFEFRDKIKETPRKRGGAEVTNSTVNRILAALRRLLNFAVARQYLEENPFPKDPKSGLFFSEKKGLRHYFTEEQMEKILEACSAWLHPIVLTLYLTGMRLGEVLGLRWEWVDLNDGIIYLPSSKTLKDPTGRGQRVVLQKELVELFKTLPQRSEWVFFRYDGGPYLRDHVYKPFKKILEALKIDPKLYSLKEIRHTTATLMYRKGAPVLAIKDQLRHTTVKTTESFYIGSDIEYQRQQIEKLVLEKPAEA